MSMKRNKGSDQLRGYHVYIFEYAKDFRMSWIIYICGLMQYAMPLRKSAMNSSRQPSIRVLRLSVGLCW